MEQSNKMFETIVDLIIAIKSTHRGGWLIEYWPYDYTEMTPQLLKEYEHACKLAVSVNGRALSKVSLQMQSNCDVVTVAVKQNFNAFAYSSPEFATIHFIRKIVKETKDKRAWCYLNSTEMEQVAAIKPEFVLINETVCEKSHRKTINLTQVDEFHDLCECFLTKKLTSMILRCKKDIQFKFV